MGASWLRCVMLCETKNWNIGLYIRPGFNPSLSTFCFSKFLLGFIQPGQKTPSVVATSVRERVQKWQAERETWQAYCILTTIERSNHSISHYSIPPKVTSITNSGSFETPSPVVLQSVWNNQSWIGSEDTKSFWRWTSQLKKITH